MHGYSRDEFMSLNLHQLEVPESVALSQSRIRHAQEHGAASFEASHLRKDGSAIPLHVSIKMAEMAGKPVIESVAVDITDRKNLEGQLLQAQKMEAVGTLAGGVAHDMNNVLSVVMGLGSVLSKEIDSADPKLDDITEIMAAASRGKSLVQNLLGFARKAEGSKKRQSPLVLERLSQAITDAIKKTAEEFAGS